MENNEKLVQKVKKILNTMKTGSFFKNIASSPYII